MIVVAIIAILAAVAIPNFVRYRKTSQMNACISNLKQIQAAKDIRLRCERLAEIGVSVADFENCLDSVYPIYGLEEGSVGWTRMKKLRDAAVAEFESGHTAQTMEGKTGWSAFNSFTYPIFNPEKVSAKIDLADVQYRGMNGTKADRVSGILAKVERALVAA